MFAYEQDHLHGRVDGRLDDLFASKDDEKKTGSQEREESRSGALELLQASGGNLAALKAKRDVREGALGNQISKDGFQGSAGSVPFQKEMEAAFQADFSHVQAYTKGAAADACAAMGAKAYTVGNQIAFRDANPTKETVAHELAHVIQQGGAGQRLVQAKETKGGSLSSMEEEAHSAAHAAANGGTATVSGQHAKRVMCEDDELSEKEGVLGWLTSFFGGKDGDKEGERGPKKATAVELLKRKPVPVEELLRLLRAKKPRYAADYTGEIKAQESMDAAEEECCQRPRQFGLAHTGWP